MKKRFAVAMWIAALGCGGGGEVPQGGDAGDRGPSGGPDGVIDVFIGQEDGTVQAEAIEDAREVGLPDEGEPLEPAEEVLVADSVEGPPVECPGQPGCPCDDQGDCYSGICVETMEGWVCASPCEDETSCPAGWKCLALAGTGGDVIYGCVDPSARLCRPCKRDSECLPGVGATPGAKYACLEYGPEGKFCGVPCEGPSDCPNGFSCKEVPFDRGSIKQCVAVGEGGCPCTEKYKEEGALTDCFIENQYGRCYGERTCDSECSAKVPVPEACNNLDDDCDGQTDEDVPSTPCDLTNVYGTCPGETRCLGGQEVCEGSYAMPEVCNGLDENCDGKADEGFPDLDQDGSADCADTDRDGDGIPNETDNCPDVANPDQADTDGDKVGDPCDPDKDGDGFPDAVDCGPGDPTVYPGGVEVCDGKDNDCDGQSDEGLCEDGVACTVDLCDAVTKNCIHAPNDSLCDDGNGCTRDFCSATEGCLNEALAGKPCDDGDLCTSGDVCTGDGKCQGQPKPSCCNENGDCDDQNACTLDICEVAQATCRYIPVADGTPCDADASGCTQNDTCQGGVCVAGTVVTCPSSFDPCYRNACKPTGPETYTCDLEPSPVDTPCDDKSPCTVNDKCDGAGNCLPGSPVPGCCTQAEDCNDNNPCTMDACNVLTGECHHSTLEDGTSCDADQNGCTVGDKCLFGVCVAGSPATCPPTGNPCVRNKCQSVDSFNYICQSENLSPGSPCDDKSPCTVNDKCDGAGNCLPGSPVPGCCTQAEDCNDNNPCTMDACNVLTGECHHSTLEDGTSCDADQNGCTVGDKCLFGVCVAGSPATCPPTGNPCVSNKCQSIDPFNYICQSENVPSGTPCDDANVCTSGDACNGLGACVGTPVQDCCKTAADCNDGNPCTKDTCEVATGKCRYEAIANGTPCDADGNGCTQGDQCLAGSCVAGPPVVCQSDPSPCVQKTCRSTGPNTFVCDTAYSDPSVPCDDGKFCTVGDHCDGQGACVAGGPRDCGSAATTCQEAVCSEVQQKCLITNKPDGSPCSDNDGCTLGDVCAGGDCIPGEAADCSSYSDACNMGECVPLEGEFYECRKKPKPAGAACDDGQFCTVGEKCDGQGSCKGGQPRDCQEEVGDACNTGYCEESLDSCIKVRKPDGTPCDDGNACTLSDSCQNGLCIGHDDACVEEQLNVAGPGERQPAVGSLGYGRYVTQWQGTAAMQNYIRLSDAYGSRENEEVVVAPSNSGKQWSTRIAADTGGNFLILAYRGPTEASGWSATLAAALYGIKFRYDGVRLHEKDLAALSASCCCYCSVSVTALRAVPLAYTDGTFGVVFSWDTTGGSNPPVREIEYAPLASDLTPGARVTLVPQANSGGADRFDASYVPDGSDNFILTWVDSSKTKVYVQRYDKQGSPIFPSPVLVVDVGTGKEVYQTRVLGFSDSKFVAFWDTSDGNGRGVFGQMFYSGGTPMGQAFRVNQQVTSDQRLGDAARFSDNGFVVVFDDAAGDVNGYAVRARRYDNRGNALGSEQVVNTKTPGNQVLPAVGVLASDEWVVAYVDSDKRVWTRRFKKDGTPSMGKVEVRANTTTAGAQASPRAATAHGGNTLIVYESPVFGKERSEVLGRLFDANGREVKAEFQVNTYDREAQTSPAVAGGPDRFVVVWDSVGQDGDLDGIYGQLFYGDGKTLGSEFRVNETTVDVQHQPSVGMVESGTFFVAWAGYVPTPGSLSDVFAKVYGPDGNTVKAEFRVNTTTQSAQERPYVAPGKNDFVVAWQSRDQDGSGLGVVMRKFSATGQALTNEVLINTSTTGDQRNVVLSVSPNQERLLACWESFGQDAANSWAVVCQYFAYSDLSKAGTEFHPHALTAGHQLYPAVAYLPGGDVLVAWASEGVDSQGLGIQYRKFTGAGAAVGPRIVANRTWAGDQTRPFLAPLPGETSFFVGWQSEGQDGDSSGVYFRLMPVLQ